MIPHLPECCIARLIQTHGISYRVQKVVSLRVKEVPAGHLGALVPASEGRAGELESAALEHHAAHPRQPEPGEAEAGDGLVGGVLYPHLQPHCLTWSLVTPSPSCRGGPAAGSSGAPRPHPTAASAGSRMECPHLSIQAPGKTEIVSVKGSLPT